MTCVNGRALDDDAKNNVIDRILSVWKRNPDLRLGQLIYVATGGTDIFWIEDLKLAEEIETINRIIADDN